MGSDEADSAPLPREISPQDDQHPMQTTFLKTNDLFVDGERGVSLAQTTWSTSVSNPRLFGCVYELFILVYLSLCLVVHLIIYHILSACSRITVSGLSDSALSFIRPQLAKIHACTSF